MTVETAREIVAEAINEGRVRGISDRESQVLDELEVLLGCAEVVSADVERTMARFASPLVPFNMWDQAVSC